MNRVSKKPEGQPTRGKTASNRLRRVDNFILLYEPSLLTRTDGLFAESLFVDLGYGFDPRTTLESAARFRRLNPDLKILGVEIDRERVEAAQPFADEKTFFRLGGFNLPLQGSERVRLMRAFNVLRQYEEKDFIPAYERLAEYVLPGGLMIEGTSDPFGSIWTANLARRVMESDGLLSSREDLRIGAWRIEALVFSTNFRLGFEAGEFQTVLPKNYIHRVVEGEPIHEFFEAWKRSAAETAHAKVFGWKQWFAVSAERLFEKGFKVDLHKKWLGRGWLIWYLPGTFA
ncbi:MAG: methylase [Chloroflexi bacterium]|nr:methylase [Chloroflexota bacterium]MDL1944122.1 methylase [Chloroflexi bacterium CFX2]